MILTILICVHSNTKYNDNLLIDAICSLEKQTYKDFDVLVVLDECWEHTMNKLNYEKFNLNIKYLEKIKKLPQISIKRIILKIIILYLLESFRHLYYTPGHPCATLSTGKQKAPPIGGAFLKKFKLFLRIHLFLYLLE